MRFYHIINSRRTAVLTIATRISEPIEATPGHWRLVECAISYCAPIESCFSRPRGRMIAESRLSNRKAMPPFKRFSFFTGDPKGLKAQILCFLQGALPLGWARELIHKELGRLRAIEAAKKAAGRP